MRSLRDAEHAVALLDLVDMLLTELPGMEIRVDGRLVDRAGARELVRAHVERAHCSGKMGAA